MHLGLHSPSAKAVKGSVRSVPGKDPSGLAIKCAVLPGYVTQG